MVKSKYSKVLTVLVVILVIGILGLLIFLGVDYYQSYMISKETSEYVENFKGELSKDDDDKDDTNVDSDGSALDGIIKDDEANQGSNNNNNGTTGGFKPYKGFGVVGIIEIPKINLDLPILEKDTKTSLDTSVAFQYGVGINQIGNSVIVGHNYRNGTFFSNNDKLELGDKIYVTGESGETLTYTIYEKFQTTPSDTSFFQRNTADSAELTLSSCTDDSSERIIILAKTEPLT